MRTNKKLSFEIPPFRNRNSESSPELAQNPTLKQKQTLPKPKRSARYPHRRDASVLRTRPAEQRQLTNLSEKRGSKNSLKLLLKQMRKEEVSTATAQSLINWGSKIGSSLNIFQSLNQDYDKSQSDQCFSYCSSLLVCNKIRPPTAQKAQLKPLQIRLANFTLQQTYFGKQPFSSIPTFSEFTIQKQNTMKIMLETEAVKASTPVIRFLLQPNSDQINCSRGIIVTTKLSMGRSSTPPTNIAGPFQKQTKRRLRTERKIEILITLWKPIQFLMFTDNTKVGPAIRQVIARNLFFDQEVTEGSLVCRYEMQQRELINQRKVGPEPNLKSTAARRANLRGYSVSIIKEW